MNMIENAMDKDSYMMPAVPGGYMMPPVYQAQFAPCTPCVPAAPCIPQETVITDVKLARAYVPYQKLCTTFPPVEGLDKGTIFPELYSPYKGADKCERPPKYD
jgi:hypothetical protein